MPPEELANVAAFSGTKAYGHLNRLAGAIGPQPAASPGEGRPGQYIAKMFRSPGFTTRRQQIPSRTFFNGNTHN